MKKGATMPSSNNLPAYATVLLILGLPLAAADHDGDPLPDTAELLACGFPAVSGTINSLPPAAGRCTGPDYSNPVFSQAACGGCQSRTLFGFVDEPLTPGEEIPPEPLPPVPVPPLGPFGTPPVNVPVATVEGRRDPGDPERYCVTVTPAGQSPIPQCADLGSAAALLPPIGPLAVLGVPAQSVGPTPGIPAGGLGNTPPVPVPATSLDVVLSIQWVEGRLNQRIGPGAINYWEPIDLDDSADVLWFAANGQNTSLDLTLALRADGDIVESSTARIPFLGQIVAAELKNAGV